MDFIARGCHVFVFQLRRIIGSIRIPFVLILIGCYIVQILVPVLDFCHDVEIRVTPYAFVHLNNDFVCQLVMMAGVVILFCDAPFEENEYTYMLPRSGRGSWALGQVMYVMVMSLLYVAFLFLISIAPFFGHLEFSTEWGKIWGTLAKTSAGASYGVMFSVTEYIILHFHAVSALFMSLALEWACATMIGLLMYSLNKLFRLPVGTIIAAFVVLLDICISNDWLNWANHFSPITLAQLSAYSGWNLRYHVTMTYGILFFAIGIPVLIIISICVNEKERLWQKIKRCCMRVNRQTLSLR